VRRVGLTGGIGAGKSTVARMLAERGAVVIDADLIARELVEPGQPALAELVEAFGPQVLRSDGSLNRGLLAHLAFGSPEATQRLNAIMHPRIARESARRIEAVHGVEVVVYDMPLLVETGQQDAVDVVVVVDVPEDEQMRRAVTFRGLGEEDVRRRMQAQAGRSERTGVADYVIDNSGTLEQTREQVDALWRALTTSPAADVRRGEACRSDQP